MKTYWNIDNREQLEDEAADAWEVGEYERAGTLWNELACELIREQTRKIDECRAELQKIVESLGKVD